MTKQAQVGVFAILALLLLFGMFFVITDFGTRHNGYRVGIHFQSAAGLPAGALVYFSGVTVGSVDAIELLPDNTVDVILAVNKDIDIPAASRFLIQAPLTGSPSLVIVPPTPPIRPPGSGPTPPPLPLPVLPKRVLPIADQPKGTNSATIADLLDQGQGEVKKLDAMLTELQASEPRLLARLQSTIDNANQLTATANESVVALTTQARQIADSLQTTITAASSNVVDLTGNLNSTVSRNSAKVDSIMTSLSHTAVALNQSVDSLRELATNKKVKKNVIDTTQNIAELTNTVSHLASDLRNITGNPQTQAQLRDTIAQLDAATQKANALLATLGGSSHVYGVDPGASPLPANSPTSVPGTPSPSGKGSVAGIKRGLGSIVKNLYAIQLRVGYLDRQRVVGTNPLLGRDRGPQTDFNVVLLPKGDTSFMVGANDIGARTTYNLAALKAYGKYAHVGGGVLYSRLGVLGQVDAGHFGVEGRAYDLRRPTLDLYGNLNLVQWAKLFVGKRDITRPERRTVFGIQLQF